MIQYQSLLVSMILEGPNIDVQSSKPQVPAALSIAQLITFNSVKHKRTSDNRVSQEVCHSRNQETPLPLHIGLEMHAATRKRSLVDSLFELGLCVSYDHVITVLTELANGVCQQFQTDHAMCPPKLKCSVFTTAAVDNIDHNPSSTSARLFSRYCHFFAAAFRLRLPGH